MQISGRAPELSLEQREKRKMAKRIIKAIQPALEDAIRKESELNRQPFEQELKDLDVMLGGSVLSGRGSEIDSAERIGDETFEKPEPEKPELGDNPDKMDVEPDSTAKSEPQEKAPESTAELIAPDDNLQSRLSESQQAEAVVTDENAPAEPTATNDATATLVQPQSDAQLEASPESTGDAEERNQPTSEQTTEAPRVPLSPPPLQGDQHHFLAQGGIQWYMQPFDPVGTTIHEERWTGREVMRGLSEELSELDEEELNDLVDDDELGAGAAGTGGSTNGVADSSAGEQGMKVRRTRRQWRGFK